MLGHSLVQELIKELQVWPGLVLSSHKSAGQLYHKLAFLADLGLTDADDGIPQIISSVKAHHSEEGLFQLPVDISPSHGGSGVDGMERVGFRSEEAPVRMADFSGVPDQ